MLDDTIVITMVRDEGPMLDRWLEYYGSVVGRKNLIVLDDNSTDGSTTGLGVSIIRVPEYEEAVDRTEEPGKRTGFNTRRTRLVNSVASAMLAYVRTVVYTDVDEFLVPDPEHYESLAQYLDTTSAPVQAAVGLNLLHHPAVEPALVADQPLLAQRRFAVVVPIMCKPLVKRFPTNWTTGFHGCYQPFAIDPRLWLVHAKFADRDQTLATQEKRSSWFRQGRGGPRSTWRLDVDQLANDFDSWCSADPNEVSELDPRDLDLDIVTTRDGSEAFRTWVSAGGNQLQSMRRGPVYRLPDRLRAVV